MRIVLPKPEDGEKSNTRHHHRLLSKLRDLHKEVQQKQTVKDPCKSGELTARERIDKLKDPGSYFLELSPLAGLGLYGNTKVPCGGIITGLASIAGRLCMVVANDPTVKGGSYFPITVKKHLRAQEIAEKNRLPCLYLVDSGGAYLPLQSELFGDREHFGRIFYRQAQMSSQGIAQLAAVHGHCTAGGAYIPAMSDYTVMVKGRGRIFLAGPPLVKAATGEEISSMELGGWQLHSKESGLVDAVADSDADALDLLRRRVANLPAGHKPSVNLHPSTEPHYQIENYYSHIPTSHQHRWDPKILLACLVDSSEFEEFKPDYGQTLVTGWARIKGVFVGIIANYGVLLADSAKKATHFINLCTQHNTPLLFVQNITGFMVGRDAERSGIAKEGAKMVRAVANAGVPKITLIVGGSYGAGNYAMCGRAYEGNYLFSWPQSKVAVMGAEQAYGVMSAIGSKKSSIPNRDQFLNDYHEVSSPYFATARLWDDGIIEPNQTRQVMGCALVSTLGQPEKQNPRGVIRM